MMTSRSGWMLLSLAVLSACGGASEPEPQPDPADSAGAEELPPPPEPARARVIHAAFDPLAAVVGVGFDGAEPAITELTYLRASEYQELVAGEHAISLVGADGSEILGWTPPPLGEGTSSTLVIASTADMPVIFAAATDVLTPPAENMAALRVFHGIDGLDALDVCIAGESARADGILLFAGVAPGSFAGTDGAMYAELPASGAELTIQLRTAHALPCHGRVQGVARLTSVAGNRYTLVAVGRSGGRPRIDRELLICADPPATDTSCTAVRITAR